MRRENLLLVYGEIARLYGHREWIDLYPVEHERTLRPAIALSVPSHVAELSLSNTVQLLYVLGIQRCRKTIHDWLQKADLPGVV